MDVFDLRARLVANYQNLTRSFIKIRGPRINGFVDDALTEEPTWREPLIQLNPTFSLGGMIDVLIGNGLLHPECARIFRIDNTDSDHTGKPLGLHGHQRKAIHKTKEGPSYVLTSVTGSGKASLTSCRSDESCKGMPVSKFAVSTRLATQHQVCCSPYSEMRVS